jgi:Sec-independent protein secretion pathway component TatC
MCYFYKDILLIIFSIPILNLSTDTISEFSNLIYTHPFELFKIHLFFAIIISFWLFIPYIFWHVLDFLKSSLIKHNYKLLLKQVIIVIITFFLVNSFFFYYFLPNIWFFLKKFNISNSSNKVLKFFFELRVEEYFNFVLDFLYLTNLLILLFLFFFFIIILFGVSNIVYWKKLFIFINIVCATLLSPPDVYSQIFILFILSLVFESLIIINLYLYKLNITYEKLIWHHIKRD